jgi:predicted Zn-dependent peptidase
MSSFSLRFVACLTLGLLACKKDGDATVPVEQGANGDPDAPVALVWPDEKYRYDQPAPGPIAELKLPEIESFELENGLKVYLVQQSVLPTVYMSMQFDMGTVSDPSSKLGLTSLCMDTVDEGTKKLDKVAWEAKQADHAVGVWTNGGQETSSVTVRALKAQVGPALDLAAEMLKEPGLRQEDFDRLKERRKAQLKQRQATPSSIARRLYPNLVFGAKHPYGRLETEKTIDAVKLSDCKRVASKLRPKGARMFVVGMITADEIKKELGDRFGTWKGNAPRHKKAAKAAPRKGQIVFVHADEANQSQVYVGHPGPLRTAEDYEATQIMVQILGGGFSSRINMNLREDKGYSYGGRGRFSYKKHGGYFVATAQVRADATGDSLREMAKEISNMRSSDPTDEEMSREIDGRLLALPASFGSATRTSFAFQNIIFHGLPLDWYAQYQSKLKALDVAAVRKAAETHLQDSGFTVLVVGDANVVLDDLEAIAKDEVFGGGGLKIVDADGKPAKAPSKDEANKDAASNDKPAKKGEKAKGDKPNVSNKPKKGDK